MWCNVVTRVRCDKTKLESGYTWEQLELRTMRLFQTKVCLDSLTSKVSDKQCVRLRHFCHRMMEIVSKENDNFVRKGDELTSL